MIEDDVSILQDVTLGGTGKEDGDRHPKVRRGVLIGAGAKILGNIEIGDCSRVAAGSVVLKPVPPHSTVAGVPARVDRRGRLHGARPQPWTRWWRTSAIQARLRPASSDSQGVAGRPERRIRRRPFPQSREKEFREPPGNREAAGVFPEALQPAVDRASSQRPQKSDSAEVYIGDEFIGVIFRDDEDGDLSYNFTMAILDIDLE